MAKLLEYRGYHAKVEYDPGGQFACGKCSGISDSLNFHAENTKRPYPNTFITALTIILHFVPKLERA